MFLLLKHILVTSKPFTGMFLLLKNILVTSKPFMFLLLKYILVILQPFMFLLHKHISCYTLTHCVFTGDLLDFFEQQNCGDSLQPTSNSPGRMPAIPGV